MVLFSYLEAPCPAYRWCGGEMLLNHHAVYLVGFNSFEKKSSVSNGDVDGVWFIQGEV